MKRLALGVCLALIVAGSLGAIYVVGFMIPAAVNMPTGLSLRISVNGTTINEGEKLAITATIFNTLHSYSTVLPKDSWPFRGLLMFSGNWPPCEYHSPFEIVVLKGNYSGEQVRALDPGSVPEGTCKESWTIENLNFTANSDMVLVVARSISLPGYGIRTSGPVSVSITLTTNGYWVVSGLLSYPTSYGGGEYSYLPAPHPFTKGAYTIAVGDEWGQVDVVHLTVE